MMRRILASAALVALAACGGGGGASSTIVPGTGPKAPALASFKLKLPGKTTMAQVRRPFYQSQATAGVAIDWSSTDPRNPNLGYSITQTCPPTLPTGITSCYLDASGSTIYTFQFDMSPGTYTFTVTTFDAAPTGTTADASSFATTANMLAQGQLAAPITINAGVDNPIPNLTFYGIPASVSFVPAPSQSHVTTVNGTMAIIGNAPQTFYAEPLDADGFIIGANDSGAPTLTVYEATTDPIPFFKVAKGTGTDQFTVTAIAAPGDGSTTGTLEAKAVANGSGLQTIQNAYKLLPVQELWTSQLFTTPDGIVGYPLLLSNAFVPTNYIDYLPDSTSLCGSSGCQFEWGTTLPDGSFEFISATAPQQVFQYTQATGSQGLNAPTAPIATFSGSQNITAITADTSGNVFYADASTNTLYATNEAFSPASLSKTGLTAAPTSIAIAPSSPNLPSAFAGAIVVGTSSGLVIYSPFNAAFSSGNPAKGGPNASSAVGFDAFGYLWNYDGANIAVYSLTGTPSNPTLNQLATATTSALGVSAGTNMFAATAQGGMWMGQGGGTVAGLNRFSSVGTSVVLNQIAGTPTFNTSTVFPAFVVP